MYVFIIIIIYFCRNDDDEEPRMRPQSFIEMESEHELKSNNPVMISDLGNHVASYHKDTNMLFAHEYEELKVKFLTFLKPLK